MKKIVVASTNPVKINAALGGFQKAFPKQKFTVLGISVASGVSDQPMTDTETYQGAYNRAHNARQQHPQADYWVGLEGGVNDQGGEMRSSAWIVVLDQKRLGKARTGTFIVPPPVAELIRGGMEMGHADDQIFGTSNSKQVNGAIGLLTHNVIHRASFYEMAVILALVSFLNPDLY